MSRDQPLYGRVLACFEHAIRHQIGNKPLALDELLSVLEGPSEEIVRQVGPDAFAAYQRVVRAIRLWPQMPVEHQKHFLSE